jgi:hypothetical protein
VITEVTVRVRPLPAATHYEGWRWASFTAGADAMRTLAQSDLLPTVLRLTRGLRPSVSVAEPATRRVLRAFGPVVAGRGVVQISAWVDLLLASFLAIGALAALRYSQVLYLLPISLFGMSVAAAELPTLSTMDHDDRSGIVARLDRGLGRVGVSHPHAERAGRQVDARRLFRAHVGAEADRLLAEPHHELGAHDPLGESGEVLDLGGEHELATGLIAGRGRFALEHQRLEAGPGGVDSRGEPGGPGPDDDDLGSRGLAHLDFPAWKGCSRVRHNQRSPVLCGANLCI